MNPAIAFLALSFALRPVFAAGPDSMQGRNAIRNETGLLLATKPPCVAQELLVEKARAWKPPEKTCPLTERIFTELEHAASGLHSRCEVLQHWMVLAAKVPGRCKPGAKKNPTMIQAKKMIEKPHEQFPDLDRISRGLLIGDAPEIFRKECAVSAMAAIETVRMLRGFQINHFTRARWELDYFCEEKSDFRGNYLLFIGGGEGATSNPRSMDTLESSLHQ